MKWRWFRRTADFFQDPTGKDPRLLFVALSIVFLSTLDAISTLFLMEAGMVTEANPFMALLIEKDVALFARTKTALTAGGVVVLVALVDRPLFPRITRRLFPGRGNFRVRNLLEWILVGYICLMGYHAGLLSLFFLG